MHCLLLIIEPRGQREACDDAEARARYAALVAFGEGLGSTLLASESLRSDRHGVRVKVQHDQPVLRDGPFAETREMLGGFFLLDCASLEEAVAIARACPAARFATVEVRECAPCFVH